MAFFGLFKSQEQREMEAQLKFRQGKGRINRFVSQSRQAADRYWQLARQAFKLGDQEQFRQLAATYLRTREGINRWERYLIKLDTLEMRRNDVASTGEFLKSVTSMTQSIMRGASAEEIARMQLELEQAMFKTDAVEQALDIAMQAAGDSLTGTPELSDDILKQITTGIEGELAPAATSNANDKDLDAKIHAALNDVARQMHKES